MKKVVGLDIGSYKFAKATKQVTIVLPTAMSLEQVLIITNVTRGVIVYNFADPMLGGTLVSTPSGANYNNVVTLSYDTSAMADADRLQIHILDSTSPASDTAVVPLLQTLNTLTQAQNDNSQLLRQILRIMESSGNVDASGRQKIAVDVLTSLAAAITGPATTGLGVVTNSNNNGQASCVKIAFGDWNANSVGSPAAVFDSRFYLIDMTRMAFQQSLRNKLT